MSLYFEKLENKIALSSFGYHSIGHIRPPIHVHVKNIPVIPVKIEPIIPFKIIVVSPPANVPVIRTLTMPMFVVYHNSDGTFQCKDGPLSTGYELDIKFTPGKN